MPPEKFWHHRDRVISVSDKRPGCGEFFWPEAFVIHVESFRAITCHISIPNKCAFVSVSIQTHISTGQ